MEPNIYFPEDHSLDESLIDDDALFILKKLRDAGHTAYLVGGSVRDILTNQKPKDFDISTSALPEQIKAIFKRSCLLIGKRFRLAHIRFGRKIFEVSTFRAGDPGETELIVRDNEWGTPEEDARRRDFSINALFYDPHHKTVIDYVEGWHDLKAGLLKSIGSPEVRFRQDPVRMIRLLKFHARFHFEIRPECLKALQACRREITKSSPARVLEELLRMLESGHGKEFFELLSKHGLLELLIPDLDRSLKGKEGPKIFEFLETADIIHQKNQTITLERSILLSCLLFPIVEAHISDHERRHKKNPNLGEIQLICWSVLKASMTNAFTHFPRKISSLCIYILMTQYRLTPLVKKKQTRNRFLSDKTFPLALRFLKIRALVDDSLSDLFYEWEKLMRQTGHHQDKKPKYLSNKRKPRRGKKRSARPCP